LYCVNICFYRGLFSFFRLFFIFCFLCCFWYRLNNE